MLFLGVLGFGIRTLGLWAIVLGLLVSAGITAVAAVRIHRASNGVGYRRVYDQTLKVPVVYMGLASVGLFTAARLAVVPHSVVQLLVVAGTVFGGVLVAAYRFGLVDG